MKTDWTYKDFFHSFLQTKFKVCGMFNCQLLQKVFAELEIKDKERKMAKKITENLQTSGNFVYMFKSTKYIILL